jgi:hypothetical protein
MASFPAMGISKGYTTAEVITPVENTGDDTSYRSLVSDDSAICVLLAISANITLKS